MPLTSETAPVPREVMRERILVEAEAQLFKLGYRAMSVDALASGVGISKKTLYQHFESKEAIALAVVRRLNERLEAFVLALHEQAVDPVETLRQKTAFVVETLSALSGEWHGDLKRYLPEAWREIEQTKARQAVAFERLLERGIRLGTFRRDLNPKLATTMYMAALGALTDPDVLAKGEITVAEAFDTVLGVFLEGIQAP